MALRHAVLAALLDGERTGYELAKVFDVGVANFWHALPQQLYLELAKLERDGLVTGRQVIQETRPNKRLFTVTDAGVAELARFTETPARPTFIRDDLLVAVQASDAVDTAAVIEQLAERARIAEAKLAIFDSMLRRLRGDLDEESFLRRGERVGPYLTCLRGRRFEEENRDWCTWTASVLRARTAVGERKG
jgi:DNA-binding PadR family transcriptional regulator